MSREGTLILLGALTIVLPFAGLPSSWLRVLMPLLGLAIVLVGINDRAKRRATVSSAAFPEEAARTI